MTIIRRHLRVRLVERDRIYVSERRNAERVWERLSAVDKVLQYGIYLHPQFVKTSLTSSAQCTELIIREKFLL